MEWLNEPASWQRTGDVLTVSVDPGTDFWRETGYGYIRDSGHVYGEVLAGDLDVAVRIRGILKTQYDQAGVMLRADEQTWLKTGIEFFEGRPRLSTVLTLGRSSWMVTDLPGGADGLLLRVSRRGDAVEVRYAAGDGPAELAGLVYLPPGRAVLAGVMCAAPEGPGFRVSFHDLQIIERDWSAAAEPAPPGEAVDSSHQAWAPAPAPAPAPEDAVADWDRLAAGAQARGGQAAVPAERWTAQADADVANEWPGPPVPSASRPADPPASPDPADEWISLLTADPADE